MFVFPVGKQPRSLESLCPVGDPLMIDDNEKPFLCGLEPGKPTCPALYSCHVTPGEFYSCHYYYR